MLPSFARESVTRLRAPLVEDEYHNEVQDWSGASPLTITGCLVQPLSSSEYTIEREAITTRWRLFAPTGSDVKATDRVVWRGDTFEVEGDPQTWDSPSGATSSMQALLRKVTG